LSAGLGKIFLERFQEGSPVREGEGLFGWQGGSGREEHRQEQGWHWSLPPFQKKEG